MTGKTLVETGVCIFMFYILGYVVVDILYRLSTASYMVPGHMIKHGGIFGKLSAYLMIFLNKSFFVVYVIFLLVAILTNAK